MGVKSVVATLLGIKGRNGTSIASDANPVPVTGTVTSTPSGTQDVDVTGNTVGLATSAKQDTQQTALDGIKTGTDKIPASPSQEHVTAASPHAVRLSDGTGFYKATTPSDTQPISAVSLPLPTGAATAARQDTANTSLSSIDSKTPTPKTLDYDTGAGTDTVPAQGILLPKSGGAVAGGTGTDPVRVDPTGSTTQPISASSLPLPTGAATEATLGTLLTESTFTAEDFATQTTLEAARALLATIDADTSNLDVALSTRASESTLASLLTESAFQARINTLGQKTSAQSTPVVLPSDQTVSVSGPLTDAELRASDVAITLAGEQVDVSDRAARDLGKVDVASLDQYTPTDVDSGAGTENAVPVSWRKTASGGSVEFGTSSNPVRTDPTGSTTQPISASSLPLPSGAATESTLATLLTEATFAAEDFATQTTLAALLTELQLKADLTETQPVSDASRSGDLQAGAETTVSSTAVLIYTANASDKEVTVQNTGVGIMRIGPTGVTATTGFRLTPGGHKVFSDPVTTNDLYAIRDGATDTTALVQAVR